MREEARKRGGEFLSPHYRYAPAKLEWRCAKGHVFWKTGKAVRGGTWCSVCRRSPTPYTLDEMRDIARARGGRCVSCTLEVGTRAAFACAAGHRWDAAPGEIRGGSWCKRCASTARRLGIDAMRTLAQARGGVCLSATYVNSGTTLTWRCGKGHEWDATPGSVKSGKWCGRCQGKGRLALEDLVAAARSRGGLCLSTKALPSPQRMSWQCAKGHRWKATGTTINQGHWCPVCGHAVPLGLGVMRTVARQRGGRCLSRNYRGGTQKLEWKCAKGHRFRATSGNVRNNGTWCPRCAGQLITLADAREAARGFGGKCLETTYRQGVPLRWRCAKGHEFTKLIYFVRQGQWCPECSPSARLTIEKLQAAARKWDGRCLSKTYKPGRRVEWRCAKGHRWKQFAPNVVSGGNWCRQCRANGARARASEST